jgi:putative phosphoribosyl transferase
MAVPRRAGGIIVFAHGSGSSRYSPRHNYLAQLLHRARLGTLLFDLLTDAETADRDREFDVRLLAMRLLRATEWLESQPEAAELPVGYFGGTTGAAAALVASTQAGHILRAVACRGGRPDLADDFLPLVQVPTLCIVAEKDAVGRDVSERALQRILAPKELVVIGGATESFDEPGALEEVAQLAGGWFGKHLAE